MSPLRVLAVSAQGPNAPAFRIRVLALRAELAREGVDVSAEPLFSEAAAERFRTATGIEKARTLLGARRSLRSRLGHATADVTLVQRQVDMLPSRSLEVAAIAGRRLVLDVDDAIWLDTLPEAGGHRLAFLKNSARTVARLASRAETVMAGNELLAEWLAVHAQNVVVVPSVVDTRAQGVRSHSERSEVVWGWIGSSSSERHLHEIAPRLAEAARQLPRGLTARLDVLGGRAPRVPGVRVREVRWSEAAEREALAVMDVGLMPLQDDAWTRGKCSFKAIQYMAAGIPVVTDDVGVSARVVGDREGGLVAGDRAGWVPALLELSADPDLRTRLGAAGRHRVDNEFSLHRWAPVVAGVLRGDPIRRD